MFAATVRGVCVFSSLLFASSDVLRDIQSVFIISFVRVSTAAVCVSE